VPDIDPGDLARIEVLRGPQGTLFGANSMGGLINYVTADPSTERFSGRFDAGTNYVKNGAEPGYNFRGSANIPISDTFAMRVSAFNRQDPGYIDNPALNLKRVNEADTYGMRAAGLWKPSDQFSMRVNALFQDTQQNGSSDVVQGLGLFGQNYLPGAGKIHRTIQAYSATLDYHTDYFKVESVTGYSYYKSHKSSDVTDSFYGTEVQALYGVGAGAPFFFNDNTSRVTQELRLSGTLWERLDWLAGGYYSHESDANRTSVIPAADLQTGQIIGPYFNYYLLSPITFDERSVFANLTYHFTDKFDVQVGGRETHDKFVLSETAITGPYATQFLGGSPSFSPSLSSTSNTFTYLFTPRYKISADWMVYARLASGYRPGGPNTPLPGIPAQSEPDKTQSYELGSKNELFGGALSLDASVYYIDWKNIQLQLESAQGSFYSANGSAAKSEGVEVSVAFKPLPGMTISGWGSYDNAVLTQNLPSGSTAFGLIGDRLPDSAKWSGNIDINQEFPVQGEVLGFAGGRVTFIGDRLGVFGSPSAPQRQDYPGYTKLDLRMGVRYKAWTATVYANNVTDRRGLLGGGLGYFPADAFVYTPPRVVGLSISDHF